jgi:large subunit ribosomal protein L5
MNRIYLWNKHVLNKDHLYKLQRTNAYENPTLVKMIFNVSQNVAINDSKQILSCLTAVELITTQKPIIYRSKKSIAAFKLRKNAIIGCKLTLRKSNMYEFLDSLVFLVLPKLPNFKGFLQTKSKNNVNIGLTNLVDFPQLNHNSDRFQQKMGATITFIGNKSRKQSKVLNLVLNSFQLPHY